MAAFTGAGATLAAAARTGRAAGFAGAVVALVTLLDETVVLLDLDAVDLLKMFALTLLLDGCTEALTGLPDRDCVAGALLLAVGLPADGAGFAADLAGVLSDAERTEAAPAAPLADDLAAFDGALTDGDATGDDLDEA